MKSFYQTIKEEFGNRYIRHSCVSAESTQLIFRDFLQKKKIRHAVEIGTWCGVSAAFMTCYADKVSTIDMQWRAEPRILWASLGRTDKITAYTIRSEEEKSEILDNLDFDFAFIDGGHRYSNVRWDFALTQKCGRVLFHDYYNADDKIPGLSGRKTDDVKRFVDTLPSHELTIKKPFAYWEKRPQ